MGKFEVLGFLTVRRMSGDDQYYRYGEIHEGLRTQDISLSYTSVWRSINSLACDGLLEVIFEGGPLQRTAKFRAKLSSKIQSSGMKRVHNTYRKQQESSGRAVPREALAARRAAPTPALARHSGGE